MKNQNTTNKLNKELIKRIIMILISVVLITLAIYAIVNIIKKQNREYEIEQITEFKYYTIRNNSKVGVIDTNGNQIIPPEYDGINIPNPSKPVFICIYNYNVYIIKGVENCF